MNQIEDRIVFADALRAIAIFAVVFQHLSGVFPTARVPDEVTHVGGWGVDCLFVLTGFLLGRPYLQAILAPDTRRFPSSRLFFARRFFRLFPLYAVAVIFTAAASHVHGRDGASFANVAVHLTFLHGFFTRYDGEPFGPLWTMAVDAQFYLALPVVSFLLYRTLGRRSHATRVAAIGAVIVAACIVSLIWRYEMTVHRPLVLSDLNTVTVFVRNLIGMSTSFALGIALALLSVLNVRLPRWACMVALALGVLFGVLFCIFAAGRGPLQDGRVNVTFGDLAGGLSGAFLLVGLIDGRFGIFGRIARAPATAAVAALSYAVYLFHKPVIVGIQTLMAKHGHTRTAGDAVVYLILVTITLSGGAIVAHRFIEKPFLKLRDRSRESAIRNPAPAAAGRESEQPRELELSDAV